MRSLSFWLALLWLAGSVRAGEVVWNDPPKVAPPGVEHRVMESRLARTRVGFNVYLPPQYREVNRRFPVVYYLAGMGDTESTEVELARVVDGGIRAGTLTPMIVVFVNGGQLSFYADAQGGGAPVESVIIQELIPHVDATFRTLADREHRGVQGFSMGGFGALKLAFKYPDQFGSVVASATGLYDGAMMKKKLGKVLKAGFGGDPEKFDAQLPTLFAERNGDRIRGRVSVRLATGSKELLLELCRRMHQRLGELNIPHEYVEVPGVGHKPEQMGARAGLANFQFHGKRFAQAGP